MYDYIIVGGGSAGCVLAARLSEDPDMSDLLLEAGPRDRNLYIHLPVGFFKMTAGPLIWGFETEPGRELGGRKMLYPQARVLGGGSSINAQVFTRGCPEDYDNWRDNEGCTGWGYSDMLAYFRKSEGNAPSAARITEMKGHLASVRAAASIDAGLSSCRTGSRVAFQRGFQRRSPGWSRLLPNRNERRQAQQHRGRLSQAGGKPAQSIDQNRRIGQSYRY